MTDAASWMAAALNPGPADAPATPDVPAGFDPFAEEPAAAPQPDPAPSSVVAADTFDPFADEPAAQQPAAASAAEPASTAQPAAFDPFADEPAAAPQPDPAASSVVAADAFDPFAEEPAPAQPTPFAGAPAQLSAGGDGATVALDADTAALLRSLSDATGREPGALVAQALRVLACAHGVE